MVEIKRLVIAGAGSLGRELANWARDDIGVRLAFMDDTMPNIDAVDGIPMLGPISGAGLDPADGVIISVASPQAREIIAKRLTGAQIPIYLDKLTVARGNRIGFGSILFPLAVISVGARIGRHCIINVHSSIGHDVRMGDYCTISSHVDICGHVKLGERVFMGSGSRILPGLCIGNDAVIGAGAVVMRDVPDGETWVGNPARKLK